MKFLIIPLLALIPVWFSGCTQSAVGEEQHAPKVSENGATFKEGKGVSLTETMAQSIGLKTAEVAGEKIAPVLVVRLQTLQQGNEAVGWLSPEQAATVKPYMEVELRPAGGVDAPALKGKIFRVEKTTVVSGGDYELTVQSATPLDSNTALSATIHLEAKEDLTSIPRSALLSTAEGHFVYAKNGEFYVRTPVKVGAISSTQVEVTDGLYTGDEIVTQPVMSLWLAELQILRGGKACTCGH